MGRDHRLDRRLIDRQLALDRERPVWRGILPIDLAAVALAERPLAGRRAPLAAAVQHDRPADRSGHAAAQLGRLQVPSALCEAGRAGKVLIGER